MTAPAAPVITFRGATSGTVRVRWNSVTGAATYKVYRGGIATGQTVTDSTGGKNEAIVSCGSGDSLTVTAVNAGAEESAASNAIAPAAMGGDASFPPQAPGR